MKTKNHKANKWNKLRLDAFIFASIIDFRAIWYAEKNEIVIKTLY